MASYSIETRRKPEEVLHRAEAFFGRDGLGLKQSGNGRGYHFEGGGGHVDVTACSEDNRTIVELDTREWDYQVREFMRKVTR